MSNLAAAVVQTVSTKNNEPELINIIGRFEKMNEESQKYVSEIENKLYNILSCNGDRNPNKSEENVVQDKNCFIAAIEIELSKYNELNYRLRNILDHLGKLI